MTACAACATDVGENAKFCSECGAPVAERASAEYKQVTVLFADVVRSMDLAATVGPERLREIMTELVDVATAVVRRYGGTVDKFTGDGIMAVFGAPATLEDHAFRACLAAVELQSAELDGVQLRIGLNSGQVIAGEVGSKSAGYTAIGEQVGLAQRMESVAPAGGIMLSESTGRLVADAVTLGEREHVQIKGSATPVSARRLLAIGSQRPSHRAETALVGRNWELNTVTSLLDEAIGGAGCVITLAGPPGIGKSRLVREAAAIARSRGVPVFSAYCESHTSDVSFRVIAQLLRAATGVQGLDADAAHAEIQRQFPAADPVDVLLLEDFLGVGDASSASEVAEVSPDARRRRLTSLINGASIRQTEPAVYVIEDVHWIDGSSEAMLCDFLAVVPQTRSLTLLTYRPEYRGPLASLAGAQNVVLRPLNDSQVSTLTATLLGDDPSIREVSDLVRTRAAGNPFFAEEMVRDLTERGVIEGRPGAYERRESAVEVNVPATLTATIGARIDRLEPAAKKTLNAAALIGIRFADDLLGLLVDDPKTAPLIDADLIRQVAFDPHPEYTFRHPLIRTVAYESQLKSDLVQRHRQLAAAIERLGSPDEDAPMIAEHMEAGGDLHAAHAWHMRAGNCLNTRDIAAARTSWRRARQVADRLPDGDPDRLSMQIGPRAMLLGTVWRVGSVRPGDRSFDELRELCNAAGDPQSLAIGMAGLVTAQSNTNSTRAASLLADDLVALLDSIGDPDLTAALAGGAIGAKFETAQLTDILTLAERIIAVRGEHPTDAGPIGILPLASVFAARGTSRCYLGQPGWKADWQRAFDVARSTSTSASGNVDPFVIAGVMYHAWLHPVANGVLVPTADMLRDTAENLTLAEQLTDDLGFYLAKLAHGILLLYSDSPSRTAGLELLSTVRDDAFREKYMAANWPTVDVLIAREMAAGGEIARAIELARSVCNHDFVVGRPIWQPMCIGILVDALLHRGAEDDLAEAQAVIDRLAGKPVDSGYVLNEIWLLRLRALLARAEGNDVGYRDYRDSYRKMATDLGFEGHIAWAAEMA